MRGSRQLAGGCSKLRWSPPPGAPSLPIEERLLDSLPGRIGGLALRAARSASPPGCGSPKRLRRAYGLPRSLSSGSGTASGQVQRGLGEELLLRLRRRALAQLVPTPPASLADPATTKPGPVPCPPGGKSPPAPGREGVAQFVLPHIAPAAGPSAQPSSYVFCLDVSSSMGSLGAWSLSSCSRLSLALTYLACYVERALAPRDAFMVLGFAGECRPMLGWRQRGDAFSRDSFMDACRDAIAACHRSGTALFGAFAEACRLLQQRVNFPAGAPRPAAGTAVAGLSGDAAGQGSSAVGWPANRWTALGVPAGFSAPAAGSQVQEHEEGQPGVALGYAAEGEAGAGLPLEAPCGPSAATQLLPPPTNAVLLLTDGEACDPEAFPLAHFAACCPTFDFKASLIKIGGAAMPWSHAPPLSALAHSKAGAPLPYISYTQLDLPPALDVCCTSSRATLRQMSSAFNTFSRLPSAAGSTWTAASAASSTWTATSVRRPAESLVG